MRATQSLGRYKRQLGKDKPATVGGIVVFVVLLAAVFAPLLTPYGPSDQNPGQSLESVSWSHPLGTDLFGRDVLTRLIYGAGRALLIGFGAVAFALAIGGSLGLVTGFRDAYGSLDK